MPVCRFAERNQVLQSSDTINSVGSGFIVFYYRAVALDAETKIMSTSFYGVYDIRVDTIFDIPCCDESTRYSTNLLEIGGET